MVKITRGGVTTDAEESISEFRARKQKERISKRGLSRREKKRLERQKPISAGFTVEELEQAGEKGSDIAKVKRKTGEIEFIRRGAKVKIKQPKGTTLITKADGTKVFQRIIKTNTGTVIQETKAEPRFFGRSGKITQAQISGTRIFTPKDVKKKDDFTIIDEFTGLDTKVDIKSRGIPVPSGTKIDTAKRRIKKETKKVLSIPAVKKRIQSTKESVKIVDDVTKFLVNKLGVRKGYEKVEDFVNFVDPKVTKLEEKGLKTIGFSDSKAKSLSKKSEKFRKDFGTGLALDIAKDIVDEPTKNAALFFAAAGFSKGAKVLGKGVQNLSKSGFTKTAIALKGAGVLGISGLTVAYGTDVFTKANQELAATGTIRGTVKDTAREMLIFSLGAKFGGRLTKAEKVKLRQYNRLKAQLSKKDLAKLNRLSKKAKEDFFLVERLEGLKEIKIVRGKGRGIKTKTTTVKETTTKLTKSKSKIKPKKEIKLKGEGTKFVEVTDKFGKVSQKGKIKIEATLKDGKLIITQKNIITGKEGKPVKFKFDKFDANQFKRVGVVRKGKKDFLDIFEVEVLKSGKLKITPTKKVVTTKTKPKRTTRKAPKREVTPIVEKTTVTTGGGKVKGEITDVQVFSLKPVKTKPSTLKKPSTPTGLGKKKLGFFLFDDKGKLVFGIGKKRSNIIVDLAKKTTKTTKSTPAPKGRQVAVTKKKTKTRAKTKKVEKPILSVVSAAPPVEETVLIPFTTVKQAKIPATIITPIAKPTPISKPIVITKTKRISDISRKPVTATISISKPDTRKKPKFIVEQIPEQRQEQTPILTLTQKPKLQVEQKLKVSITKAAKTTFKKKIVPIPFFKFDSEAKVKPKKKVSKSKQITFFTPTIVGDVKLRKKKDEELPFFSGLEVRP